MKAEDIFETKTPRGIMAKDLYDRPSKPHIPTSNGVYTAQVTLDRVLILLNAINQGRGIEEMEQELDVSRQIVQRLLKVLKEGGYYTAQMGKSGRKEKNKSRSLTAAGYALLRGAGYRV